MTVEPGLYLHYKGGFYTVLFVTTNSTNGSSDEGKEMVVYVSLTTGKLKVRELEQFCEKVVWPVETARNLCVNPENRSDKQRRFPRFVQWFEGPACDVMTDRRKKQSSFMENSPAAGYRKGDV